MVHSALIGCFVLITLVGALPNRDASDQYDLFDRFDEYIAKVAKVTADEARLLQDVRNFYQSSIDGNSIQNVDEEDFQDYAPRGGKRENRPRPGKRSEEIKASSN